MAGVGNAEVEGRLKEIAEAAARSRGVELVELIHRQTGRRQLIRLLVDRVGGVTVDECAAVSRRMAADLDMAEFVQGRYTLEVSSPGIDRPLKTAADFRRKQGRRVHVRYNNDNGDKPETVEGLIVAVDEDSVTVDTMRLMLDQVIEGKLIV